MRDVIDQAREYALHQGAGDPVALIAFDPDTGEMTMRPFDESKRLATALTDGGKSLTIVAVSGPTPPAPKPPPRQFVIIAEQIDDGLDNFKVEVFANEHPVPSSLHFPVAEFRTHRELLGAHIARRQEVFDR